jgi:hypothetical protein
MGNPFILLTTAEIGPAEFANILTCLTESNLKISSNAHSSPEVQNALGQSIPASAVFLQTD